MASAAQGPENPKGNTHLGKETCERLRLRGTYDNYIGGKLEPPTKGRYFENRSPVTGEVTAQVARSTGEDIEKALGAAHLARTAWGKTPPAQRAAVLNKIADRMEQNIEYLAQVESWDNGKPLRETMGADLPLAIDHFRYFAGCARTQAGNISEIDENTVAYHFHEPLGVVGAIIPWNFPLLMAAWKLAPALAAGNCVVLKPAEQTPVSVMHLMDLVGDLLPPGVVGVVEGYGPEAGKALACNPRTDKISFTGETTTGRLIMQYASEKIIPVTLELGGKSPNVFCSDIFAKDDGLADKALEAFAMFAFNQGQVCSCPSRVLIQEDIFSRFMEKAIARVKRIKHGNPMDPTTVMGSQVSEEQLAKILSYVDIGKQEGADLVLGGHRAQMTGDFAQGYYMEPTVFVGQNRMRIFQEEVFGPFVSVTKFKTVEDAMAIANDTPYGLAGAVWTRDGNQAYKMARQMQAGRVWINAYHLYPAHAAFGGYKQSGFGRENYAATLDHYQQTKCIMGHYTEAPLGFY